MKNLYNFPLFVLLAFTLKPVCVYGFISTLLPEKTEDVILLNQVGYYPWSPKVALLKVRSTKFEVVEVKTGKTVFTGTPGAFRYWEYAGDSVSIVDFSDFKELGDFQIRLADKSIVSFPFSIGTAIYADIAKASLKAFYLNRTGIELNKEFAGKWARLAGHPDTMVFIHASAASSLRPEGSILKSPGGWYDAGDYNKYIVNSAITTYTLLLFYQLYPDYCQNLNTNIPESSNTISDVLDELLENLRWMLTMQDPNDGGVYHKLTNKTFCDFVMPHQATDARYVVAKSTAASLDFAATMAMAYRVLGQEKSNKLQQLAKHCLQASKKAYQWAKLNSECYYNNPVDISTGAYDDKVLEDEFFWAECELGLAESNQMLLAQVRIENQKPMVQSWDYVSMLGITSLALSKNPIAKAYSDKAQNVLTSLVDELIQKSTDSPFNLSLDFFRWGSNSDVANMAVLKIIAYKLTYNHKYINAMQSDVDYLLGRNATAYCFVTGFGHKRVMNIHHRPSGADGIEEPCPGFLVGGPNIVVLNDCPSVQRSTKPAKSFVDLLCSYSTNEIAINWNAPLFFVLGALDSLSK